MHDIILLVLVPTVHAVLALFAGVWIVNAITGAGLPYLIALLPVFGDLWILVLGAIGMHTGVIKREHRSGK